MVQFIDLWRGHPINESVTAPCVAPHDLTNMEGQTVHMGFPVFHNQCAIRLGVALRRARVLAVGTVVDDHRKARRLRCGDILDADLRRDRIGRGQGSKVAHAAIYKPAPIADKREGGNKIAR